jgi:glycosyltransferase involved in cell wall biosynthesis
MKIAFLAQRHSIHTVRWVNALAERGYVVHLLSSTHHGEPLNPSITFHPLPFPPPRGYFFNVLALKKLLGQIQPDLLNAHFASGYGSLARLSGFHPYVLNVWGSDVFDFPEKSPLHRALLRANLKAADWICSTSQIMRERTRTLASSSQHISVVPFGIDTGKFMPSPNKKESELLTIGTVKTLAHKYGIDLLIKAFAKLRKESSGHLADRLRLLIVGGGPEEASLKTLAKDLNINDVTQFSGPIAHHLVPDYLNQLDIYVALSRLESESFGVAVLEASACALPVVVANVGGLPEVVQHEKTGLIVDKENVDAAMKALKLLVEDELLRRELGKAGRQFTITTYDWNLNVSQLEEVYQESLLLQG